MTNAEQARLRGYAKKKTSRLETILDPAWEKQLRESRQAFAAFVLFRDAGAGRSYRETTEKLQKNERLIWEWGRLWRWQGRGAKLGESWAKERGRRGGKSRIVALGHG
jgi:hypothetical protein